MLSGFFGLCCSSRSKDDVHGQRSTLVERPMEYIKTRPGLVSVLRWFDQVEEKFRESLIDCGETIDNVISDLDG